MIKKKVSKTAPVYSYHHGDLRNALISAALEILEEKGAKNLSLREIAKISGVSHNAPYKHFKDKESVLAAIAEDGHKKLAEAMETRLSKIKDDAAKQFQETGIAYVHFAIAHPNHVRVMFGNFIDDPSCHESLAKEGRGSFQILVNSIIRCQNENLIEKGDPLPLAIASWSAVHGLSMLLIENQLMGLHKNKKELEKIIGFVTNTIYKGLSIK